MNLCYELFPPIIDPGDCWLHPDLLSLSSKALKPDVAVFVCPIAKLTAATFIRAWNQSKQEILLLYHNHTISKYMTVVPGDQDHPFTKAKVVLSDRWSLIGGLIRQVVSYRLIIIPELWDILEWSYKPGSYSWGGLIRQVVSHGVVL